MITYSLAWRYMPIIPAVANLKLEDNHEFKASLSYIIL